MAGGSVLQPKSCAHCMGFESPVSCWCPMTLSAIEVLGDLAMPKGWWLEQLEARAVKLREENQPAYETSRWAEPDRLRIQMIVDLEGWLHGRPFPFPRKKTIEKIVAKQMKVYRKAYLERERKLEMDHLRAVKADERAARAEARVGGGKCWVRKWGRRIRHNRS